MNKTKTEIGKEGEDKAGAFDFWILLPLALIQFVDAVSFTIVAPSLVFYVRQAGGTQQQYGWTLSAFSLASFLTKPLLGRWSDRLGGKYRTPYLASVVVGAIGGFVYFLAGAFTGNTALFLIVAGRLLNGCGAANMALGYSYVAQVVPQKIMTRASATLTMTKVFGMTVSPVFNVLLDKVHGTLYIGHYPLQLDPLNSVGLTLALGYMLGFLIIYFLLDEPPESTKPTSKIDDVDEKSWVFWRNVFSMEILVPWLAVFTVMMNFQLIETCLAPVAHDVYGWNPVRISTLFGLNSVLLFGFIVLVFKLCAMGVTDPSLMKVGCLLSVISYTLIYFWWNRAAPAWQFIVSYSMTTMAFPFLGAPTRSLYTVAVYNNDYLAAHHGTMQALLSMVTNIPGFVGPGLIAHFVLRTPDQVDLSSDKREFEPWALFAPALAALSWIGLIHVLRTSHRLSVAATEMREPSMDEFEIDERLALLADEMEDHFHPRVEAYRRQSAMLMYIPQISFHHDRPHRPQRHTL